MYSAHTRDMNTTSATQAPVNEYRVAIVDTDMNWHTIVIYRSDWRGVKAAARKVAKGRGIEVKFINDFYLAS